MSLHSCDQSEDASDRTENQIGSPLEGRPRVLDSRQLFGRQTEISILHAGETYRLRITRQGKLILNK